MDTANNRDYRRNTTLFSSDATQLQRIELARRLRRTKRRLLLDYVDRSNGRTSKCLSDSSHEFSPLKYRYPDYMGETSSVNDESIASDTTN